MPDERIFNKTFSAIGKSPAQLKSLVLTSALAEDAAYEKFLTKPDLL